MIDQLENIEQRYQELEQAMSKPDVASNHLKFQVLAQEYAALKNLVSLGREYRDVINEIESVRTLSRESSDQEILLLAKEESFRLEELKDELQQKLRVALLPKDPNDDKNIVMEVRAGTGGDEAGLFANDLFRMYTRYAQRQEWEIEIVDANRTGIGAIKEIVYQIRGKGAYSRLKHESGVHRVQRVPVTESSGRIHTSAATVAVLPEAEEVEVEVDPDDLEIDIFHSSGHGGQNVQKVATAIRITHKPTGIVAICQDERSQAKNKDKAMSVLRARILAQEVEKQQSEERQARRKQVGTGDRSERARTYNFPQNRITDHRIDLTSHGLESVLDGELDEIIDALIEREQADKLSEIMA
ncbi:MAG: peptide chain release factor 1 [Chloroflexota bacterium]|nr:peptide chain release factor 1 [Chloroflexota bacterium]